jgi:4-hydroxy-tetrahydrodipicolinate reductase
MKIALLGYGKMGKIIEKIAIDRKHEIVLKIDYNNQDELTAENLQKADVAIEFSTPATVLSNIRHCFNAGVPIVIGTTGWYDELSKIKQQCEEGNNALIYASNFSVGVNVFST